MIFLGIDLSTSGIKCVAYNKNGIMFGKVYREYDIHMPKEGVAHRLYDSCSSCRLWYGEMLFS